MLLLNLWNTSTIGFCPVKSLNKNVACCKIYKSYFWDDFGNSNTWGIHNFKVLCLEYHLCNSKNSFNISLDLQGSLFSNCLFVWLSCMQATNVRSFYFWCVSFHCHNMVHIIMVYFIIEDLFESFKLTCTPYNYSKWWFWWKQLILFH